jgi:hypothetical protein
VHVRILGNATPVLIVRKTMRRLGWLSALLVGLAVAILLLGYANLGPLRPAFHRPVSAAAHRGIARIDLVPIPEGPLGPAFEPTPTACSGSVCPKPLATIQRFIPDPLPAPLNQWSCGGGGDLVVTLGDGKQVIYGPCHRPASIDSLWAEMIYVMDDGKCAPRCGPGGATGP